MVVQSRIRGTFDPQSQREAAQNESGRVDGR